MKKKTVLILILFIIILVIAILIALSKSGLSPVKVTKFIDQYNIFIEENMNVETTIKYPENSDKDGATYWMPINNNISFGISTDNYQPIVDLKKDEVIASAIKYDIDEHNYEEINMYLYFLIKTNNDKISEENINNIISDLRKHPDEEIKKFNLIIKHTSSDYQIDSISRVEK